MVESNLGVIEHLKKLSTMSRLSGNHFHQYNSYLKAARSISELETDIRQIEDFTEIQFVGGVISEEIRQYLAFGENTVKLRKYMATAVTPEGRVPYVVAEEVVNTYINLMFEGTNFLVVGSYRRKKADIGDLDILFCGTADVAYSKIEEAGGIKSYGAEKRIRFTHPDFTMGVDVRVCTPDVFVFHLLHMTGSVSNNIAMRRRAVEMGYSLSEWGIADKDGNYLPGDWTEESVYEFLGMKYLTPEQR